MPREKTSAFSPSFMSVDSAVSAKRKKWTKVINLRKKAISVKNILKKALSIEDYYNNNFNLKTSMKTVHKQNDSVVKYPMVTYYFSGFMLSRQDENDECRIIDCGEVQGLRDSYTADYLIYYSSPTNSITLILKQTNRENEIVGLDKDLSRAEMNWDKAVIKIFLNDNKEIINVVYDAKEMHLSRSKISIILKDISLFKKFPEITEAIKLYLVLPRVDSILRKSELAEEKTVRLSLLSKCNEHPESITREEIKEIKRSLYYKSWAIRQNIIRTLSSLEKIGKVNSTEIEKAIKQAEARDIKEDFLVIERSIRKDEDFVIETIKNIHKQNIVFENISKIIIEYFDKGKNKQVYKAKVLLKNRKFYIVAFSVIRYIFQGYTLGEFSDENLKVSIAGWEIQSKINPRNVCQLGTYRWYDDYRPRVADEDVKFPIEFQVEVDRNKWIYNNLLVVSREFVDGIDLENVINNKHLSKSTIKNIVVQAIKSYLSIWSKTKDNEEKGWHLGDPKPANIIVYQDKSKRIKAKVIDFDALHKSGTLQEYLDSFKYFKYNPRLVKNVLNKMNLSYHITA